LNNHETKKRKIKKEKSKKKNQKRKTKKEKPKKKNTRMSNEVYLLDMVSIELDFENKRILMISKNIKN